MSEPVVFDFIKGEVRGTVAGERMWPHYYSTYCIHGRHDDCRRTCKVCASPCLCDCHAATDAEAR